MLWADEKQESVKERERWRRPAYLMAVRKQGDGEAERQRMLQNEQWMLKKIYPSKAVSHPSCPDPIARQPFQP